MSDADIAADRKRDRRAKAAQDAGFDPLWQSAPWPQPLDAAASEDRHPAARIRIRISPAGFARALKALLDKAMRRGC